LSDQEIKSVEVEEQWSSRSQGKKKKVVKKEVQPGKEDDLKVRKMRMR